MTRRSPPSWGERAYALLVRLLCPAAFHDRFGDEMVEFLRDRLHEERARRGTRGVTLTWARAIPDLFSTAIREHAAALASPIAVPSTRPPDPMSTRLFSDARFALRGFRKNPVFFGVAVLVVALGTGAVSTIFSVANAVVLRPVPGVRDASSLIEVSRSRAGAAGFALGVVSLLQVPCRSHLVARGSRRVGDDPAHALDRRTGRAGPRQRRQRQLLHRPRGAPRTRTLLLRHR